MKGDFCMQQLEAELKVSSLLLWFLRKQETAESCWRNNSGNYQQDPETVLQEWERQGRLALPEPRESHSGHTIKDCESYRTRVNPLALDFTSNTDHKECLDAIWVSVCLFSKLLCVVCARNKHHFCRNFFLTQHTEL